MSNKCSVEVCERDSCCKGLCDPHYRRFSKQGEVFDRSTIRNKAINGHPLDFIKKAINSDSKDCILWPFSNNGYYGKVGYKGKSDYAHRVSLELFLGRDIIKGMEVAHSPTLCSSKLCINPKHLREATKMENERDKLVAGTITRGSNHKNSKLNELDIVRIINDERTHSLIAHDYGVSRSVVSEIKRRESWRHVTQEKLK